jgi:hypothetical protein
MSEIFTPPETRYAALVETFEGRGDAIQSGRGFGSTGLRAENGKIFAMLVQGKLVVKLPRQRVDALVASGDGERFDSGGGRIMKEWLALAPTSEMAWLPIAEEARVFVATTG